MFKDIAEGVISNAAYSLILILGLLSVFLLQRRRRLKFFGLSRRNTNLNVLMSRVLVPEGTAVKGYDHTPRRGFTGKAITEVEFQAVALVLELFSSAWDRFAGAVNELFHTKVPLRVTVVPSACPDDEEFPAGLAPWDKGPCILIGSGTYNFGTSVVLGTNSPFRFEWSAVPEVWEGREFSKKRVRPEEGDGGWGIDYAIVERIKWPPGEDRNVVLVCAGMGSAATFAATWFVARAWRDLQRQHNDRNFALVLEVTCKDLEDPWTIYGFGRDAIRSQDYLSIAGVRALNPPEPRSSRRRRRARSRRISP